jgi:hypothetical protein
MNNRCRKGPSGYGPDEPYDKESTKTRPWNSEITAYDIQNIFIEE